MSISTVKTRSIILMSIAVVMIASCKNNQPRKVVDAVQVHMDNSVAKYDLLSKAGWILGSWRGVIGEGVSVENWIQINDSTYSGAGLFIKGKVNLSEESIQLYQHGSDLYYAPTVKNQNDGKPVIFKMSSMTPKKIIFENSQHDFPQKITYVQHTADSIVATISGIDKGMVRSEDFPMTRKK